MIPNYTLYGENKDAAFPDILHCESIATRSKKHDWVIAPHRHHALHQFFLLQSGGGEITLDEKSHHLSPPVAISIPPLVPHGFEFEKDTVGWVITIPDVIMTEILLHSPDIKHRLADPTLFEDAHYIAPFFEQISEEHRKMSLGRNQLLAHLTGLLAVHLGRRLSDRDLLKNNIQTKQHVITRTFLDCLEKSFRGNHSVQEYADQLKMTAQHLTRNCRQITGRSTSELIQDRLLLEAKRSLVYTRMPVSELAYSLGFNDPAHFSKFFKRKTTYSPSQFRENSDPLANR